MSDDYEPGDDGRIRLDGPGVLIAGCDPIPKEDRLPAWARREVRFLRRSLDRILAAADTKSAVRTVLAIERAREALKTSGVRRLLTLAGEFPDAFDVEGGDPVFVAKRMGLETFGKTPPPPPDSVNMVVTEIGPIRFSTPPAGFSTESA